MVSQQQAETEPRLQGVILKQKHAIRHLQPSPTTIQPSGTQSKPKGLAEQWLQGLPEIAQYVQT